MKVGPISFRFVIAGSVGGVLYLYYGFLRIEAAVVAVAVLTGLVLFNALSR